MGRDDEPTGKLTPPSSTSATGSKLDIAYLVKGLLKYNASDLHLKAGRPPLYRINGKLVPARMADLTREKVEAIIADILSPHQRVALESKKQVDFSFQVGELGRFRCNVYYQKGTLAAAIRMIPYTIRALAELGIPTEAVQEMCRRSAGMILITGATGSGKSTTLASLVQYLNENSQVHILSLEDPIEFVYRDLKASITQREVGQDMASIHDGLIAGLRQDPDVIVIGEMRDTSTIQVALTAAETGHLVIATLHTNDATSTITRILDVFPTGSRDQIRTQLASSLVGILAQQLLVRADGTGRIPACEVMIKSPAIEGYIFRNELERIPEAISGSNNYYKMQSMNQSLEKLVKNETVTPEEALRVSPNPDDLKLIFAGLDRSEGYNQ